MPLPLRLVKQAEKQYRVPRESIGAVDGQPAADDFQARGQAAEEGSRESDGMRKRSLVFLC